MSLIVDCSIYLAEGSGEKQVAYFTDSIETALLKEGYLSLVDKGSTNS
jgi:hypothetical protein